MNNLNLGDVVSHIYKRTGWLMARTSVECLCMGTCVHVNICFFLCVSAHVKVCLWLMAAQCIIISTDSKSCFCIHRLIHSQLWTQHYYAPLVSVCYCNVVYRGFIYVMSHAWQGAMLVQEWLLEGETQNVFYPECEQLHRCLYAEQ